ncbi:MAG: hypothetical protein ACRECO_16090 [Xanthobacteraceae bacterium]
MNRRAFLVGCAVAPLAIRAARAGVSYFTAAEHAALESDPSTIAALYAANRTRFISDLGSSFAGEIEEHRKFGFCGLVAYDSRPYGTSIIIKDLPSVEAVKYLLTASHVDCDNYCALAWHLFRLLVPTPTTNLAVVGIDHGLVGNHAFLTAQKQADANGNGGGYWIVDPTVGLMNCGHGIDWLMGGKPINMVYTKSFYWRSDVDVFNGNVKAAMQNGLHRPSHLLYFTRSIQKFVVHAPMEDWMTPGSEGKF